MHTEGRSPPTCVRAGGTVLTFIASPLSVPILRAHRDGPMRLFDLPERIDGAAQTTLRGQVEKLRGFGALERHVRGGMPYTVENELTDAGRDVLAVADLVEHWLSRAPRGPIPLGSEAAKVAIRALVGGWDSTILHGLAVGPLSLTELNGAIAELSYPALERRLSAMRASQQVEPRQKDERRMRPYGVTAWIRQAVSPLMAASRCEGRHLPELTKPLTKIDIETAFLLSVPLVKLRRSRKGTCLLAVDTGGVRLKHRVDGVHVVVEAGAVASCVSQLERRPGTRALGTVESWVDALLEGHLDRVRLEGEDRDLARAVIENLCRTLPAV